MIKCERCRYWVWDRIARVSSKVSGFTGIGECRRSSPVCASQFSNQAYWPVSANLQCCGAGKWRLFKVKCIAIVPEKKTTVDQAKLAKAIHDLSFTVDLKKGDKI